MAINGINEKILFQRGGNSVDGAASITTNPYLTKPKDLKRKDNQGVLVIDPNKVVNQYNEIVDRYVKQEDLMIYASLKVYKRPQSAVVSKRGETRRNENISEAININFLNPLKNEKRADGTYKNKGKFTSEWTDFFTSDSANDKKSSDYLLDPETFGITNINIRINANNLPLITIQFTDIQGRMLFERGNEKDNPYNIFFTYPYPKFLLTYKGYYGKAVEVPMVLLKSNTKFDPSTGNYNVTAEFQSEIFALFNTFLIIYAYVAPYMYQLENGTYLGQKILESLYDKQNAKIKESLSNSNQINQYENYKIDNYPTLFDLARALKIIPTDVINGIRTDEAVDSNELLLKEKNTLENYDPSVRNFISNSPDNYRIAQNNNDLVLYEPIPNDGEYVISDTTESPSQLFDYLKTMNEAIKNIADIKKGGGKDTTFSADLLNEIEQKKSTTNTNSDLFVKYVNSKKNKGGIKIEKILTGDLFAYNGNDANDFVNPVFLDNYNEMMSIVFKNISKLQSEIEEDYVTEQITNLGEKLGYKPNMSNILRILSNNMQTFLILLDITGKSALRQLETNLQRVKIQEKFSDYKKEFDKLIHTPFPNYYKTKPEYINGKTVDRVTLAYPGNESINNEWFEVNFVEEIYKALDRINLLANPKKTGVTQSTPTGILSLFQLGEADLSTYPSKETGRILGEMYSKYSIFSAYSGLPYRSITNFGTNVSGKLADFEATGVTRNVLSKMSNIFVIANELARATRTFTDETDGVNYTNVGNFGLKHIKFGDGTVANAKAVLTPMFSELSNYTSGAYTSANYNASINKLNKLFEPPANRDDGTGKLIGVGNKSLYETIKYKPSGNDINFYSTHAEKKPGELKHYIDLKPNANYYCDIPITLTVDAIDSDKYKGVFDGLTGNINPFEGFYFSMNDNLRKITINSDFSRSLSYARSEDLPSLTFNTITDDYTNMGDYQPFKKITKPTEDFTQTFNI
jgi:hypothetical protein